MLVILLLRKSCLVLLMLCFIELLQEQAGNLGRSGGLSSLALPQFSSKMILLVVVDDLSLSSCFGLRSYGLFTLPTLNFIYFLIVLNYQRMLLAAICCMSILFLVFIKIFFCISILLLVDCVSFLHYQECIIGNVAKWHTWHELLNPINTSSP